MQRWYREMLAKAGTRYESLTVSTRHGETHVLAGGPADAPPVILLHGMEGNALSWRFQFPALASAYRFYAVDLLGSPGRSACVHLPLDGPSYAEWLENILDVLALERAHFVGISTGGWLVIKLAAAAPGRIASAVLLSVNGLVPVRYPYRLARYLERHPVGRAITSLSARVMTHAMARIVVKHSTPPGVRVDPDEVEWVYLLAKYYYFHYPPPPVHLHEARALTAPCLILMGAHDQFFPPRTTIARARALFPNLRTAEIIPHAGHNLLTDQPTIVNTYLLRFLSEVRQHPS